jgi:hypothetical protein
MTLVLSHIGLNKFYLTDYSCFTCCDEVQYRYYCDNHFAPMGCQFCEFDPYENCECEN